MSTSKLYVERVILKNFKRFGYFDVSLKAGVNILVGDNESGKSTILDALDLVLSETDDKLIQLD